MRGAKPDPLPHMFDHETFQTTPRYAQKLRKEKKRQNASCSIRLNAPGYQVEKLSRRHFSTMIRRKVEEALPPRGSTAAVPNEMSFCVGQFSELATMEGGSGLDSASVRCPGAHAASAAAASSAG